MNLAVTLLILVLAAGLLLLGFIVMFDARGGVNAVAGMKKRPKKNVVYTERFDIDIVRQRWSEINASMHTPSGLKHAVVEADKLLDHVLKAKGYHGETMADRMKKAQNQFSRREAVWAAHKLRNQMVHEVNHDLVPAQVHAAVKDLGQAIIDLGVRLYD
ncbi:hypothetical protein IT414_02640 [bacterium]|nr:hypothetical protein [bacterium]